MNETGYDSCPYCNSTKGFVFVHSHYQCLTCRNNVNLSCEGEMVEEIVDAEGDDSDTLVINMYMHKRG